MRVKLYLFLLASTLFLLYFYSFHQQSKSIFMWNRENDETWNEENMLTVATYNIQYGKGIDGKVNLERTILTLQALDADIISLQEVERFSIRTQYADQVTQLAQALEMNALFYPSLSYPGVYYGNAILTRFPIIESHHISFQNKGENRSAILAKVGLPNQQSIFVLNTHLGLNKQERAKAIQEIEEVIGKLEHPILLTGDLNATPEQQEFENWNHILTISNLDTPLITYYNQEWQIDYIFHSTHFSVVEISVIESDASDHYPLVGLFQLQ